MQNTLTLLKKELCNQYSDEEIRNIGILLISKVTGWSRTEIILNKNSIFSTEQQQEIKSFIEKLKKSEPIQYIIGETEFFGLSFKVDNSVLIPRPETEELLEWILQENDSSATLQILDIGTGSGCIAIGLKSVMPNAKLTGFDISEPALGIARQNATLNNLDINFEKTDILSIPEFNRKWDIIVSNPPYITPDEKQEMQPNVLNHEPHLALFVPADNPLLFYKSIATVAQKQLLPNGKLYFEINRAYGKETIDMLTEMGFCNVELRKDIFGNDRMVRAFKK